MERIPAPFASLYEKAARTARETYYAPVAEEALTILEGGRILDLGTGPGYLPIEIARRAPGVRVEGIDLSRRLIEAARRNASAAGVTDRIHFEQGDASRLRWADESFDMVISTGMVHALKKPVRVLEECLRVLKTGGTALVYDPAQVSSRIDDRGWKASLTPAERILFGLFRIFSKLNPPRQYTRQEMAGMIEEAGFRSYEIRMKDNEIRVRMTKTELTAFWRMR
jgi:ubiquinone/menaquinone biosynthesis C-methylase UbiE